MADLDRYRKRARFSTMSGLKNLGFQRRLKKDYNRELFSIGENSSKKEECIIQTSRLNETSDYKKFSANFCSKVKVGDVIYWDRLKSYWLIYLQRNTEKDYFLGEMQLAKYKIYWTDNYGKRHFTRACVRTIGTNGLSNYNGYFDTIDGTTQLLVPMNQETMTLRRYSRIKINDRVWEVVGYNDINLDNVIIFYLNETEGSLELDSEKIPFGYVEFNREIETNLDKTKNIPFNSSIDLKVLIKINGEIVKDSYNVDCDNCSYKNNSIVFDKLGKAKITIVSEDSGIEKIININVIDSQELSQIAYRIVGTNTVQTLLSYSFIFVKNTNGVEEPIRENLKWSIDMESDNDLVSLEQDQYGCRVYVKDRLGEFLLACVDNEGNRAIKRIKIKGLF